jgi:hypothetical protein
MGIFPGQKFKIDLIEDPLFTVDHLGQDGNGLFFEAKEAAPRDIPQSAPAYNKNDVNVLTLNDTSNCDNQAATLEITRHAYGAGDVFMIAAMLEYQSNIFSGLGDEGGVGCAVNILHDLEAFHGEVESWAQVAGRETTAVYKPGARNAQKLGTARPLINLNRSKWKFDGVANVIPPGTDAKDWLDKLPSPAHLGGCILVQPAAGGTDWQKFAGAFIALVGRPHPPDTIDSTDRSEYYKQGIDAVSDDVYRWWLITEVQAAGDVAFVYVDRPIQRNDQPVKAGPWLFRDDNVTLAKFQIDERALRYVIAPGAWVSDVRDGAAGDPRHILLAPGDPQLAAGDAITNPPGADVMQPVGFRVRHADHYPAFQPGASFATENLGNVQVGSALFVGNFVTPDIGEGMPAALARLQKDARPLFDKGIWIVAPTGTALRVDGYTERGAIELFQTQSEQKVVWWSPEATGFSSLHRDRASGDFVFAATIRQNPDTATLTGPLGIALKDVRGLSSTTTAAHNLCGHATVPKTTSAVTVTLSPAEADADYRVFVQCSWFTQSIVANRSTGSFDVKFSPAPAGDETFDWLLVR